MISTEADLGYQTWPCHYGSKLIIHEGLGQWIHANPGLSATKASMMHPLNSRNMPFFWGCRGSWPNCRPWWVSQRCNKRVAAATCCYSNQQNVPTCAVRIRIISVAALPLWAMRHALWPAVGLLSGWVQMTKMVALPLGMFISLLFKYIQYSYIYLLFMHSHRLFSILPPASTEHTILHIICIIYYL